MNVLQQLLRAKGVEERVAAYQRWIEWRRKHGDKFKARGGITCCGQAINMRTDGVSVPCPICGRGATYQELRLAHGLDGLTTVEDIIMDRVD